jgi:hypothetical protein
MSAEAPAAPPERTAFGRTAASILRGGMAFSAAGLVAGLALFIAGRATAGLVLAIGIVALVAMPVVNVLAILLGELRRREWPFVAATAVVIALLLLTFAWKTG